MLFRFVAVSTLAAAIPFAILFAYIVLSFRADTARDVLDQAEGSIGALVENGNRVLLQHAQKSQYIATSRVLGENLGKDFGDDLLDKVLFYSEVNQLIANVEFYENPSRSRYTIYLSNLSLYESKHFRPLTLLADGSGIREGLSALPVTQVLWHGTVVQDPSGQDCVGLYRSIPVSGAGTSLLEVLIPLSELEDALYAIALPNECQVEFLDSRPAVIGRFLVRDGRLMEAPAEEPPLATEQAALVQKSFMNGYAVRFHIPESALTRGVGQYLGAMIALFFLMLLLIALVAYLSTRRVVWRLERFVDGLDRGDALPVLPTGQDRGNEDEVATIQRKFADLIRKNDALYRENMDAVRSRRNLETSLLQMKLNPHLLYNSLAVLRWKALEKEESEIVSLLDRMTRYYRAVLGRGSDIVQVVDEIALVEDYIRICEATQAAPIHLEVDMGEAVGKLSVFKLILQPLVENAVLHGLAGKPADRTIRITGRQEDSNLVLSVEDNGVGIPPKTLDRIRAGENVRRMGGFGMKNLRERLSAYYGDDHGFCLESEAGRFTRVTLRIPVLDSASLSDRYRLEEGGTP